MLGSPGLVSFDVLLDWTGSNGPLGCPMQVEFVAASLHYLASFHGRIAKLDADWCSHLSQPAQTSNLDANFD